MVNFICTVHDILSAILVLGVNFFLFIFNFKIAIHIADISFLKTNTGVFGKKMATILIENTNGEQGLQR